MFRNPALKTLLKPLAALLAVVVGLSSQPVFALSRIKDLASVEGVRTNQLLGYGIVVGLNGTGDTLCRRCWSVSASTPAAPTCAPPTSPP